jgi:hypothetical protein
MALRDNEIACLRLLAGCPGGATDYLLTTVHKISPRSIYWLVDKLLVNAERRRINHRNGNPADDLTVWNLRITSAGLIMLQALDMEAAGNPEGPGRTASDGANEGSKAPPLREAI